jgi:hypothetical protein
MVCAIAIICCGHAVSQASLYSRSAVPNDPLAYVRQDLEVALDQLDSASLAFGLTSDEVNDVLKLSVESTGWEVRRGSDNVISVKLTPLRQRQEDMFAFQVDVAAGMFSGKTYDAIGGLTASSTIDVPAGGAVRLLAHINQAVARVSRRFRQEIMKRSFDRNRSQMPDDFNGRNGQLASPDQQ